MLARKWLSMGKVLRNPRAPILHPIALRYASNKSPFVDGGEHCNMNDVPVPEGDWAEDYARKNLKNTIILITGVSLFLTSLFMHFTDETIHWNYKVPDYDRCS